MWVDKPTAILVIHGMGEQTPLETLDAFATTMLPVMETKANGALEKHHRLLSRKTWNENYISVFPQGQRAPSIDIYEYYWAYEAERQINAGEILDWLIKVGDLARKYYQENSQFAEYHEEKEEKQKEESYIMNFISSLVTSIWKKSKDAVSNASKWASNKISEYLTSLGFDATHGFWWFVVSVFKKIASWLWKMIFNAPTIVGLLVSIILMIRNYFCDQFSRYFGLYNIRLSTQWQEFKKKIHGVVTNKITRQLVIVFAQYFFRSGTFHNILDSLGSFFKNLQTSKTNFLSNDMVNSSLNSVLSKSTFEKCDFNLSRTNSLISI